MSTVCIKNLSQSPLVFESSIKSEAEEIWYGVPDEPSPPLYAKTETEIDKNNNISSMFFI